MPDITMCSPTRFLKKCERCYRYKAKAGVWQAFSNFYEDCLKNKYEYFIKMEKWEK